MKNKIIFLSLFLMGAVVNSFSQQIIKKDAEIDAMVKEISVDSLAQNLNKLVSFAVFALIGVAITAGANELMVMPSTATSLATPFTKPIKPAFAVL